LLLLAISLFPAPEKGEDNYFMINGGGGWCRGVQPTESNLPMEIAVGEVKLDKMTCDGSSRF
jgi:hypothetical protein